MTLILVPTRSFTSREYIAGIGLRPGRAEEDRMRLGVVDARDRGVRRQYPHAGFAHDAADPAEPDRVEAGLRFVGIEQRRGRHAAVDQREDRAVPRRDIVDVVGRPYAAATEHVLHHDGRIARQILAHVMREQPAVGVVSAADRGAGDQIQVLLAAKELLGRLRMRGDRPGCDQHGRNPRRGSSSLTALRRSVSWHRSATSRRCAAASGSSC